MSKLKELVGATIESIQYRDQGEGDEFIQIILSRDTHARRLLRISTRDTVHTELCAVLDGKVQRAKQ